MKEYIKKFADASAGDDYSIADIPFTTSVEASGQNLVCNETGKKLVNILGVLEIQSAGPEPPEMVDLGLPSGTLWAKCNLGAQTETEYGQYFSWGETAQHEGWQDVNPYNGSHYKYGVDLGNSTKLTKYCQDANQGYNGFTDELTELVSSDDAATVIYGGNYRMPTVEDFQELLNETDKETSIIDDVRGYKLINKSDSSKYIFLPCCNFIEDSSKPPYGPTPGTVGHYWGSSLNTSQPWKGCYLKVNNSNTYTNISIQYGNRWHGRAIRPVQHVSNS